MNRRDEMVPIRGEDDAEDDGGLLPASLPDIGRSLRAGRERADLTIEEVAARTEAHVATIDALESGDFEPQYDRIETLRTLRRYANLLALPADDFVLVALEHWPSGARLRTTNNGDTAIVPVVPTISSAPAGGHSSANAWLGAATGVADATTTGVLDRVQPLSVTDTGQLPIVTTGEVPAVTLPTPAILKFLIGLVALLVVLAGVGLLEHNHVNGWYHSGRNSVSRWFDDTKSALGISSTPKKHATHHTSGPTKTPAHHALTTKLDPSGRAETFNVASSTFTVKITAASGPCWVQATEPGNAVPIFEEVLPAGQMHVFTVTASLVIETGSSSGRAFIYEGTKLIGFSFPTQVPFTMTFNATG